MPTLGPQIVSQSYGNLLKFLPIGDDGVTTNQVQITDGKGKVTPLYLATGSVLVDNEFTASDDVVFSGLTQVTQTNIVCIDGSGRLQTVKKYQNIKFYNLINDFFSYTGVPIILNTSFNENEPIVNHPKEAINCFNRTEMDILVLENYILIMMK